MSDLFNILGVLGSGGAGNSNNPAPAAENGNDLGDVLRFVQQAAQVLGISLSDLFPASFLQANTSFQNLTDLFTVFSATHANQNTQGNTGIDLFQQFVANNSRFGSWDEMIEQAGADYLQRQLGLPTAT